MPSQLSSSKHFKVVCLHVNVNSRRRTTLNQCWSNIAYVNIDLTLNQRCLFQRSYLNSVFEQRIRSYLNNVHIWAAYLNNNQRQINVVYSNVHIWTVLENVETIFSFSTSSISFTTSKQSCEYYQYNIFKIQIKIIQNEISWTKKFYYNSITEEYIEEYLKHREKNCMTRNLFKRFTL